MTKLIVLKKRIDLLEEYGEKNDERRLKRRKNYSTRQGRMSVFSSRTPALLTIPSRILPPRERIIS
jgi:hypothetical protein